MHVIGVMTTRNISLQMKKVTSTNNRVIKNVSQLQASGETPSILIIYLSDIGINVFVEVKQRQGCEMLVGHGRP